MLEANIVSLLLLALLVGGAIAVIIIAVVFWAMKRGERINENR